MVSTRRLEYRNITNPERVEGVVIGNSHADRILLNNKNVFYLNESSALIIDSIKEFSYSKENFKSLKYIIFNLTPVEMYTNIPLQYPSENTFLYRRSPKAYIDVFERSVTVSFSDFFDKILSFFTKNNDNSMVMENNRGFTENGRRPLSVREHENIIDWKRDSHYKKNLFIHNKELYHENLSKIKAVFANSKFKVVVVSMPLNHRYVAHMESKFNEYHLLGLSRFTNDMQSLFGKCYINLINYPLSDKYFWDGDHLNKNGAIYMEKIINKKINNCLSPQYTVH
ncbi:hypothetical protein [Gallaecimonas mangrovi]|uniref:hypothetical protein n=1 Tax=Gallaecimonas mangrovi TaxID=2291597 RepID=UPI00126028A5|nr:hypothetical protein [Gallaecimonas mangrovi]